MKKKYWFRAAVLVYVLVILLVVWESNPTETAARDLLVREAPTVAFATLALLRVVWFKRGK